MHVNTVNVSIKASKEVKGLWKTVEVGAEGTIEYGEVWQEAQARLYHELSGQLKALWNGPSNGRGAAARPQGQAPDATGQVAAPQAVEVPPAEVLAGTQARPKAAKGNRAAKGDEELCPVHKVAMRRYQNGKGAWYAHKLPDGTWCHGKAS